MNTQISNNPYEGMTIIDLEFPTASMMTVAELKQIKPLDEQRDLNREKMINRIKENGGFSGKFIRPIFISDISQGKGKGNLDDYRTADSQHTCDIIKHTIDDDVKIPVLIYKHSPREAAKAFALWNKEGVQLLSSEQVFPAQVTYSDPEAMITLNVLHKTGRKFKGIKDIPGIQTSILAKNVRTIRRGKLEEAIKINRKACELALTTQATIWPDNGKETEDVVLLTLGWTYLFNKCPVLTNTPAPFNLFVNWVKTQVKTHPTKKDQCDWIYSGKRRAQKEKLDIAKFTLEDFLQDMKILNDDNGVPHNSQTWFKDLDQALNVLKSMK